MSTLWTDLCFMVVETDASIDDVIAAVPVPTEIVDREAPRRFSLGFDIHGLYDRGATQRFALWQTSRFTVIAVPGCGYSHTGETEWPAALSTQFGRALVFSTQAWAVLAEFVAGEPACVVTTSGAEPAGEVLGTATLVDDDAACELVLGAMARLLETEDLRGLCRTGTCVLADAHP